MKSEQTSPVKDKYKVRNWGSYNKSLVERGNITLWLDPSVMRAWRDIPKKKVVGSEQYPACVIQCCLLLGKVYRQPLRQTTGFVRSLLNLLGLGAYKVPDYSTLCRRQGSLSAEVSEAIEPGKKLDIAIDSTGLKVYGEGEWKVRKHGASKRRVWQKMHIGIDIHTQQILLVKLTSHSVDDAKAAADMVEGEKRLRSFWGDGAYDDFHFREVLGPDVRQVIPPPKDAVEHKSSKKKEVPAYLEQRNEAVRFIHEQGREEWKKQSEYHLRSRNETVMFRYKTTFGGKLEARKEANQSTEIILKCKILNRFRQTGMPQAYKVA